jgi:Flp pilus assembly secretin CpaC
MADAPARRGRWLRFTLAQVLVLILGMAIGFVPFQLSLLPERSKPQFVAELRVVEVSREFLPTLGAEPSALAEGIVLSADAARELTTLLDEGRQTGKATIVAEPKLMTVDRHVASCNIEGEFPVPKLHSDGSLSIAFRRFGTRIQVLPTLLANGCIRLKVASEVSELDSSRAVTVAGTKVPGLRARSLDAQVEINDGGTVVLGRFGNAPEDVHADETLVMITVEQVKAPRTEP